MAAIPASTFQAANPMFILLFGLVFTALWGWLAARRAEPSTPVKFALGLLQLGLGFGALWLGAESADARGMVGVAGCCSATCCTRPASCVSRRSGSRW